ncbi:MAG: c-type cytochrome [Planctomycetes bacterium]|nr:c-type cytochrome [Planctomycetota bacterium]
MNAIEKRRPAVLFISLAAGLAVALWAAGCDHHDDDGHHDGDNGKDDKKSHEESQEHGEHEHDEPPVPAEYAGKTNPFAGNAEAILQGKEIYAAKCSKCHGDTGGADGIAVPKLEVKPTAFNEKAHMDEMKDDFLFWRVAEGGNFEPFHSKMPAWKDKLTEEERWKALAFVRTLANGAPHDDEHGHGAATLYTCPMHPDVVQEGPGDCPKCGMHLELKK